MKRNMKEWVAECINNPVKKAMPILSFRVYRLSDIQ